MYLVVQYQGTLNQSCSNWLTAKHAASIDIADGEVSRRIRGATNGDNCNEIDKSHLSSKW